jgi:5-methylcytosine-specific restriction enzyme A
VTKPPRIRMAGPRIKPATTRVAPLQRGGARERGYDSAWAKASAAFKRANPLCLGCRAVGISSIATMVDHVIPVACGGAFWNQSMWQPLCSHCHESVKKRLDALYVRSEITAADLWMNSPRAIAMTRGGGR